MGEDIERLRRYLQTPGSTQVAAAKIFGVSEKTLGFYARTIREQIKRSAAEDQAS